LTGYFDDHHAFICAAMLRRIDTLTADIRHMTGPVNGASRSTVPHRDGDAPGPAKATRRGVLL
jgi:hypothetical protein